MPDPVDDPLRHLRSLSTRLAGTLTEDVSHLVEDHPGWAEETSQAGEASHLGTQVSDIQVHGVPEGSLDPVRLSPDVPNQHSHLHRVH